MKAKFYLGAPTSADRRMVDQLFQEYCYAVQDYFSGSTYPKRVPGDKNVPLLFFKKELVFSDVRY